MLPVRPLGVALPASSGFWGLPPSPVLPGVHTHPSSLCLRGLVAFSPCVPTALSLLLQ